MNRRITLADIVMVLGNIVTAILYWIGRIVCALSVYFVYVPMLCIGWLINEFLIALVTIAYYVLTAVNKIHAAWTVEYDYDPEDEEV